MRSARCAGWWAANGSSRGEWECVERRLMKMIITIMIIIAIIIQYLLVV